MITAAFERQKWPKRHEHLVEECWREGRALHVSDVLPYLTGYHRELIASWNPPTHPGLTLVPRMGGPFRRWWFVCPRCERCCDGLYVPPGVQREDWRCRLCWDLIYSSQRYGFRHPLRRALTYRKKVTLRKEIFRQQRQWARRQSRLPVAAGSAVGGDDESWIKEGVALMKERLARQKAQADAVQAKLAGLTGRALAALRKAATTADTKRVREHAKTALARYARRLTPQRRPVRPTAARPAPTLSATEIERLRRVVAEDDAAP